MADEVKIDKNVFHDRLNHFLTAWKTDRRTGDSLFGGVGSIVVVLGKAEDTPYQKANALHFWLLGYEFPATLFIITPEQFYIVTTAKKSKHLEPLKGGKVPFEILIKGKEQDQNDKMWAQCVDIIKKAGKKVGVLKNDATGPFVDEWKKVYTEGIKDAEEVDVSNALSTAALSVKDEGELRSIRNASRVCTLLMTECFVDEMMGILDEEKKVKHSALATQIDRKVDDGKFFPEIKAKSPNKLPADFRDDQIDWMYGPVVQSGGYYDLKLSAQSDDKNLSAGIIIAGIGIRYKSYGSIVARTYLVDPNKSQESAYKLLLNIHETMIKEAQEGVQLKDLYAKAVALIKAKQPALEKHFLKTLGGGIGIESRDSTLLINARNTRTLKDGMTLSIMTGFTDVVNPKPAGTNPATYSLYLADTIRITKTAERIVFTKDAPADLDSTMFFFNDEEEDVKEVPKNKITKDSKVGAVATSNIRSTKLRAERTTVADDGNEQRRKAHQKELANKKQSEGLERYAEKTGNLNGAVTKKFKRFESYKRDNQLPSRVKDLSITVDPAAATVVLPIMGRPVPFHIHTIKNAAFSDEGEFSFLRINFLTPGQGVGRKDEQPFEDANANFVRSLSFRSTDADRYREIADKITELRKTIVRKEQEKKEMEDVVEQDNLVEIRNRKPLRLDNIFVRPGLDNKRLPGEVEIHQNGIRYKDHRGVNIDVLFSNVKHLFFQPCTGELIVIIHVHLKTPILIGKKKAKDVQFYREATDMAFDETGNRKRKHRMHDDEEFAMEQEERRRRAALDKEFKSFAEKLQSAGADEGLSVDIPERALGFNGVPFRSNVLMQPTTECLVQLTEPPFTVITLDEIEIAHLERVQFGLKNFDMVFVYKDFTRPVVHVNTIPTESIDAVRDWLDSVDIAYTEGPLNLNWPQIMKTVVADPHTFFEEGGWGFLSIESDDEDEDESEEESAFEISEEELDGLSEESSESEFEEDESEDEEEEEDSEDEGEDWDELEKKAKRKDREGGFESEDEERPKKKKK